VAARAASNAAATVLAGPAAHSACAAAALNQSVYVCATPVIARAAEPCQD
jgi:hypothetical protein